MMEPKKIATITFRLSPELKEALGLIAEVEVRSVSQQVEYFIKTGIRQYIRRNDYMTEQIARLGVDLDIDSGKIP